MAYLSISLLFSDNSKSEIIKIRKNIQKKFNFRSREFIDEIPHINLISGVSINSFKLKYLNTIIKNNLNKKLKVRNDGLTLIFKDRKTNIFIRYHNSNELNKLRDIIKKKKLFKKIDYYSDNLNWIPKCSIENLPNKIFLNKKIIINDLFKKVNLSKKFQIDKIAVIRYYPFSKSIKLDDLLYLINI